MTDERGGPAIPLMLVEAGIDSRVVGSTCCGGGSVADVRRIRLADGRSIIVKISARSNAGSTHLESRAHEEAAGLAAIAATGTVPVPEVIGIGTSPDDVMLVIEDMGDPIRPSESEWIEFGSRLADLHACRDDERFGFRHDNHLGDTSQDNSVGDEPSSWPIFLSTRRLGPMRRRLDDAGRLDTLDRDLLERLEQELPRMLPAGIRPGLLHGDLWSGNVHATVARGITVIDPAVFHGDPLFELGMMRLFGGFPSGCESAYFDRLVEIEGPDVLDASEVRIELGRLHHLMNHWLQFGAGYGHATRRVASSLLAMVARSGGVG